jgi:putative oxidoreductase
LGKKKDVMIQNFLFPAYNNFWFSLLLFFSRLIFGTMFLTHGLQKLANFKALSDSFPSIMGLGSTISLSLAIFAEVFCTIGFITGFLYRLSMIPMIFTMAVAVFVVHANDPFSTKEMALLYMLIFVIMYILGPGSIAADYFFVKKV